MQSDLKLNFAGFQVMLEFLEMRKLTVQQKRFIDNELYEIRIPFSDFKPCIAKYVNSLFQSTWNNCSANKLHEINETFLPSI